MRNRIVGELAVIEGQDKYAHIFDKSKGLDSDFVAPTDDQRLAEDRMRRDSMLGNFFDFGPDASFNDFENFFTATKEEIFKEEEVSLEDLEEVKVQAFTKDELSKKFDEMQYVVKRKHAIEDGLIEPDSSKSTDTVIDDRRGYETKPGFNTAAQTLRDRANNEPSWGTRSDTSRTTTQGTSSTTSSTTNAKGPRRGIDEFQGMNNAVQRLGAKHVRGWKDEGKASESYFAEQARNLPWWKKAIGKTKRFAKSGKGRITLKVACVLALQLGMAIFGKRYEFENFGQLAAVFSFMVGSFFLTRELAEEGLDVTGMIF